MVRAALLDVDFYERVEHEPSLNRQVAVVVVVANVLAGIGAAVAIGANPLSGALAGAITGLVGWVIWAVLALFVGTRFLGGTADLGEMSRVIGFSFAPLVIGIVPWLGFVGAVWALVATTIAVREGLDIPTLRAVAAMLPGWAAWLLLAIVVNGVLGLQATSFWPF